MARRRARLPGPSLLRLVIGADIVAEAPRWFAFDEIVRIAPPIVLGRAGVTAPGAGPALLPEVSSTNTISRGTCCDLESSARGETSSMK